MDFNFIEGYNPVVKEENKLVKFRADIIDSVSCIKEECAYKGAYGVKIPFYRNNINIRFAMEK